jgi:hypothetical protein
VPSRSPSTFVDSADVGPSYLTPVVIGVASGPSKTSVMADRRQKERHDQLSPADDE